LLSSSTNRGPAKPKDPLVQHLGRWQKPQLCRALLRLLDQLVIGEMIESTDIANFPAIDDQAADPRHCDHNADIERRVGLRSNVNRYYRNQ
jgi:hypothetical protein